MSNRRNWIGLAAGNVAALALVTTPEPRGGLRMKAGDPGAGACEILFNGRKHWHCVEADERAGFVDVLKGRPGHWQLLPDGSGVVVERLYGRVEIVFIPGSPWSRRGDTILYEGREYR